MATPLSIKTSRLADGTFVLKATGELDMSNIDVFAAAVTDAVTTGPQDGELLTIDLSEVEYLDSGAINALFEHADHVHLIANPVLMPVLKISGLTEAATVEAARPTA
jgi:anti-anti-sigma factor